MKPLFCILLLLILTSCAQRYQTYNVIDKKSFKEGEAHNPVHPKMRRFKRQSRKICEGQILFNRNADKEAKRELPMVLEGICEGNQYLLDAKMTYLWWTTILYSRSCIEIVAYCPQKLDIRYQR